MDNFGRLLLRFFLVPLGYFAAVLAGALVILFGSWKLGQAAAMPDPHAQAIRDLRLRCSRRRCCW